MTGSHSVDDSADNLKLVSELSIDYCWNMVKRERFVSALIL